MVEHDAPGAAARAVPRGTAGARGTRHAWSRRDTARRAVTAAALVLDLVMLLAVLTNLRGDLRVVLGLLTASLVPGMALVGLLRLRDATLELALVLATSLSVLVLVAQLVITLHAWHLYGVEIVVCACSAALLSIQLLRRPTGVRR